MDDVGAEELRFLQDLLFALRNNDEDLFRLAADERENLLDPFFAHFAGAVVPVGEGDADMLSAGVEAIFGFLDVVDGIDLGYHGFILSFLGLN